LPDLWSLLLILCKLISYSFQIISIS
jgi:hypothetical protein